MTRIMFILPLIFSISLCTSAQQKEGKVIYTRIMQMQVNFAADDELQQAMPRTRTDKFEVLFGNNKSLVKHIDEEEASEEVTGNGMMIRMVAPGQNDIVYHDFSSGTRTDQREFMDKGFIVSDTIEKLKWKITGETKMILGHMSQKATAIRTSTRTQMTMDNGRMERKDVRDTSTVHVWFTTDIPVPAGPEFQGQLPGLILEIDMNNGRVLYTATDISLQSDIASIKPPVKGKKVSSSEFRTEREKMMEEMQKNNAGGRNRIIRMN